ncbi:hypothetical protein [Dyadobacter sp. SG02]|uniref:hypothetical protein n=1 Tax=Dyadobacter sp. SG02 TaxID=1855291 RepID=UPI000B807529|nr:hypothetical protein [Dyadobacter sp. SG02]
MLHIFIAYFGLIASFSPLVQPVKTTSSPGIDELYQTADAGYFFALQQVPLSQKQYIFTADPLKRAVYIDQGQMVPLSYTMTVKSSSGFDMYFSATGYNIILSVKEQSVIDGETVEYKGYLSVRHGRQKDRYAVHGIHNR